MYKHFFKGLTDFVLSLVGAIVLLPVFILIGLAVFLNNPGPIFFKQKRIGKNKKIFTLYKFRSMKVKTPKDTPTHLLENPDRYITKVGKFLRKTSLDELPQIYNILFGKMSIVGPRPALWNQDDLIAERDKYGANGVRPGLTGWAQVNGRDELEIPVKAALDGEYVKKIGFFFDVKIFFLTIAKVFRHDGVVEGGTGTMEKRKSSAVGTESATVETVEIDGNIKAAETEAEENSNGLMDITEEAATVGEEILSIKTTERNEEDTHNGQE